MDILEAFHFLRPLWLLSVLPVLLLWFLVRPKRSGGKDAHPGIAPHLASALEVGGGGRRRVYPIDGVLVGGVILAIAAAGPTWSKLPNPLVAETAPLVIALKVTPSMESPDLPPSRLERARFKILDLIEARAGARTALVAYAGTAHRVAPLTEDPNILRPLLESLTPAVMPREGDDAAAALEVAAGILETAETPGAVLFALDDLNPADVDALNAWDPETRPPLVFLVAAPPGTPLPQLDRVSGATTVAITTDDSDIARIERRVRSAHAAALAADDRLRWDDRGWWLAWPAALLCALWFRRGWTMRWLLVLMLLHLPGPVQAEGWRDWFLTPDQQGRLAFEDKRFADAADLFEDPMWKGYASYRAGQYEAAISILSRLDSAEAAFAQGMAEIKNRQYRPAVRSFETALERRPEFPEAEHNLAVARAIVEYVEAAREASDTGEERGIGADDVVFDNEAGRGADTEMEVPDEGAAPQTAEQWIQSIDTDMGDFLRSRFLLDTAGERRMRWAVLALCFVSAATAVAQEAPRLTVDLEAEETVVGQPLILRIKVLVPTWLPSPPAFPSFEVPGLLVRLPERAGGPVSERIDGETWSGVQRAYRLYPLEPGRFEIPAQSLRVTYAVEGSTEPISEDIPLAPVTFTATVPEAARGLSPLILATGFELTADVEMPEVLEVGGAAVRTLSARIEGTTPILIPSLTPGGEIPGLRIYADEPKVSETEDRGILSGTRTERTSYLAVAEGPAELPAIRFDWFNLGTGEVETAEVPAVDLSIAPGAAAVGGAAMLPWRGLVLAVAGALCLALLLRAVWPRLTKAATRLMARWRASEVYAHRGVMAAIRKRDLGETYRAIGHWQRFFPDLPGKQIERGLAGVGAAQFGTGDRDGGAGWSGLRQTYLAQRRAARRSVTQPNRGRELRALNPDWR